MSGQPQLTDDGIAAVIMGVAVTLYTLPNGQQIVVAPYEEFVADLKSVLRPAIDQPKMGASENKPVGEWISSEGWDEIQRCNEEGYPR